MDPLTQGLLGACVGQAACGRTLGRRALGWGALLGMLPDADVVSVLWPVGEWSWHRGPTHALWFGPIVGSALGWLLASKLGGRRRDWVLLAVLALVTHPLLDAFTTYGTQLFTPFSRLRVAWDAVAIVDPLYSLLLAAALVPGLRRGASDAPSRRAAFAALALSTGYLGLGLAANARVESLARAQLALQEPGRFRIDAYPTLLQLPLRRVVARGGDEVLVGWASALRSTPIDWQRFEDARDPRVLALRGTREGRLFEWFATGQTAARVENTSAGAVVEIDDLRYGLPGDPRDGLWGIRARFDASGRLLGAPERFERFRRARTSELLGQMVRRTFGVS